LNRLSTKSRPILRNKRVVRTVMSKATTRPVSFSTCPEGISKELWALLPQGRPSYIPADLVKQITAKLSIDVETLQVQLLPVVRTLAQCDISDFQVAAIAMGASGSLYGGHNVEFPALHRSCDIHAEQHAMALAHTNKEDHIKTIVLNVIPCGFCRQFLMEVYRGKDIEIVLAQDDKRTRFLLSSLLPNAFTPTELIPGLSGALKNYNYENSVVDTSNCGTVTPLIEVAVEALKRSYCPYYKSPAGCAVQAGDVVVSGSLIENAAHNPEMNPAQAAVINLLSKGVHWKEVTKIVLVEGKGQKYSQRDIVALYAKNEMPKAKFEYITVDIKS